MGKTNFYREGRLNPGLTPWKLFQGWSEVELEENLTKLNSRGRNFPLSEGGLPDGEGWRSYYSEVTVGSEEPGPPVDGGAFERIKAAVAYYEFTDPRIVIAHFNPDDPLLGRK